MDKLYQTELIVDKAGRSTGFQLPNAEIAAAVQPGLWDGVDLSQFDATRPVSLKVSGPVIG